MTPRVADGPSGEPTRRPARRLPGEEGVWVLVLGDMIVFALFFTTYLYYRAREVALFDLSQRRLSVNFGVLNTLLLLTSSWLVVLALDALRTSRSRRGQALLGGAWLCGAGFFVVKVVEYAGKVRDGITPVSNHFFMYYYMFTGIHLVHLTIGLVVLAVMCRKARSAQPEGLRHFESGATFWHMVDLLWIMLFPLLYLVK